MALRYLRATRKDAAIRFLSTVATVGLGLGVAALILALSALSGLQSRLLSDVRQRAPELQVHVAPGFDLSAARAAVAAAPDVAATSELIVGSGWLRDRDSLAPVEIVGFDGGLPSWFPALRSSQLDGVVADPGAAGLWLPASLVTRWGLSIGDVVEVVSPRTSLTPIGPQPRSRRLPVAGFYDGGLDESRIDRIGLPLELAASLLSGSDRRIDVDLRPGISTAGIVPELERLLDPLGRRDAGEPAGLRPFELRTFEDSHRALLFVLRMEKTLIFLAVVLIVLVSSFALVASLSMVIAAKRAEIGILAAMGAAPRRLRRVFVLWGALLAGTGGLGGATLGILLALLFDRYRWLPLPYDAFILDYVPFQVEISEVSIVLLTTLVVALLASFWAARRVSLLDPVEALRR